MKSLFSKCHPEFLKTHHDTFGTSLLALSFLSLWITGLAIPSLAQAQNQASSTASEAPMVQAAITGPEDVAVGRTIVLDASLSRSTSGEILYQWFVEGQSQPISETVEAVYTPDTPDSLTFRLLVRVRLENGQEILDEEVHTVNVYARKIVLIADDTVPTEKIGLHQQTASGAGVFLRVLQPSEATTPIGSEEQLTQLLSERAASLAGADAIVLWTDGITGIQALMRSMQGNEELLASIHAQTIILISDRSLSTLARIARGPFAELEPKQILITRAEALHPLLTTGDIDSFATQIEQRDIDFLRIDASSAGIRPWNLLSSLVNAMLTRGVPSQTVILLLVLPVIAMILAFLKQVVGITTFGLYTPSIIALSFLALGWQLGVLFLLFIILTGYVTRAIMRRWRLLYIPKVALIITVVSITLMVLMGVSAFFGVTFSRETIFILLIMSTLSESFLNMKTEQGLLPAVFGIGETILASLVCVFIVQWGVFQSMILAYPELILFTIVTDIILGRWTGLRLVEYFRFREVFKHLQEE